MTNEELKRESQEVGQRLDKLSQSDEPQPKRLREWLLLRQQTLEKIKEAKEKNNRDQEFYNTVYYGILNTWGEKHPFLASFVMSRVRWGVF
jgi:hypothetical protein